MFDQLYVSPKTNNPSSVIPDVVFDRININRLKKLDIIEIEIITILFHTDKFNKPNVISNIETILSVSFS